MQRLLNTKPFTVFVVGAGRVSVPIGMSWVFPSWNTALILEKSGHRLIYN